MVSCACWGRLMCGAIAEMDDLRANSNPLSILSLLGSHCSNPRACSSCRHDWSGLLLFFFKTSAGGAEGNFRCVTTPAEPRQRFCTIPKFRFTSRARLIHLILSKTAPVRNPASLISIYHQYLPVGHGVGKLATQ
jgi:hypothetical protein